MLRPSARCLGFFTVAGLLAAAGVLHGATTGSSELLTPQGNTAATHNGDYISDTTGMQAPYRFWIEVTPGLSRLVVDLFDADVGAGGLGEDVLGRDRERADGDPYTTSATYELFDPSGTARPTRFTTGNSSGPAGADNAWLTLYDFNAAAATGHTVRDNFSARLYSNNNGTNNWAGSWAETDGGGGGATGGHIEVTNPAAELQFGSNTGAGSNNDLISRQVDLSNTGLNLTNAYLRFDYRTSNNLEDGEGIRVEVSNTGTAPWTTLETFSNDSSGSRSYDITSFISAATTIRFTSIGLDSGEFFFLDNVRIDDAETLTPGHWELRVTMNAGDDINALGIRAHDGNSGSGGTEINVYADSFYPLGVNPDPGSNERDYVHYPYLTNGCTAGRNDFDYDSNSGDVGGMVYTSRTGAFSQTFTSATLGGNDVWNRDNLVGWPSDANSTDYGIWTVQEQIRTYNTPGVNGNYAVIYHSNAQAAANPPTANPQANVLRTYFATDAGIAPVKPYLEQLLRFGGCGGGNNGPNPPLVGQTSCFTVTARIVNPTPYAITFSTPTNVVTANIPGGAAVYAGLPQVSQGSIVSQPAVGGSGNIVWNPGSVSAGATALLSYRVKATPTSAGQRIPMTGTPAGSGTNARYVDGTGNTTQARATYTQGPLCELAVTQSVITQAVVSSFRAVPGERGGVVVEWTTASEAGTAGFRLYRGDAAGKSWQLLGKGTLAGLLTAPQGGTYRFLDEGAQPGAPLVYRLEEVESSGGSHAFGPYRVTADRDSRETPPAMASTYEREAHATERPSRVRDAAVAAVAPRSTSVPIDSLWLGVDSTGLYHASVGQLGIWLGRSSAEVQKAILAGQLSLRRGGTTDVPWYPDNPTSRGRIAVNPYAVQGIYFYGVASPTLYSSLTPYRLDFGRQGTQMRAAQVDAIAPKPASSFGDRQRSETDAVPVTVVPFDPASDYWFWDYLWPGDQSGQHLHRTFAVHAPGADPSAPATLYVDLQGTTSGDDGAHDVSVSLNGTALAPLGDTTWSDLGAKRVAFAVPAGVLSASSDQLVEMTGGGAPANVFYVDGFDLDYLRGYVTDGDSLSFTIWPLAGGATVTGFSSNRVSLLDVGDPDHPRWLAGATAGGDLRGGASLSFAPISYGPFLAVGPVGLRTPQGVRGWNVAAPTGDADLLIVAPTAWLASAERLADLRRGEGLTVRVASVDEIADTYGQGVASPQALRAAIAAERGDAGRLHYVVLAGEGSVDYRNLLGYDGNKVPTQFVSTPQGLYPADNRLADLDGDGFPDLAIGRLPVQSAAQLDAVVDKLAAFSALGTPEWANHAVMLADAPDQSADFAYDSDQTAALLNSQISVDRIYVGTLGLDEARSELNAAIVGGRAVINYYGHGGLDRLTAGGVLSSNDVPSLTNGSRLSLLTAMTCSANRFGIPGFSSLGELLVRSAAGGASAVLSASGIPNSGDSRALALRLYSQQELLAQPQLRLGEWVLGGYLKARTDVADPTIFDLYNLLGDPSMKLRLGPVEQPPPDGPPPGIE